MENFENKKNISRNDELIKLEEKLNYLNKFYYLKDCYESDFCTKNFCKEKNKDNVEIKNTQTNNGIFNLTL